MIRGFVNDVTPHCCRGPQDAQCRSGCRREGGSLAERYRSDYIIVTASPEDRTGGSQRCRASFAQYDGIDQEMAPSEGLAYGRRQGVRDAHRTAPCTRSQWTPQHADAVAPSTRSRCTHPDTTSPCMSRSKSSDRYCYRSALLETRPPLRFPPVPPPTPLALAS
jgi:hypothetical protein